LLKYLVTVVKRVSALSILLQKILDADDNPLKDRHGTKMIRDIVQFVPFRKCNTQEADFSLVSGNQSHGYNKFLKFT